MPSAFRHAVEYHAAAAGLAVMRRMTPDHACRLAEAAGSLAFQLLRRRRRIAVDNIVQARIASGRAARRLARQSFRHFASVVAESFHAPAVLTAASWREAVELVAPPQTAALLETPGQGLIVVSGHIGNWEVAAQALTFLKPVTGIARRMNNPSVQALLERSRMRGQFETIDKHAAQPRRLLRALRDGRVLALLTDQHAPNNNCWIDFFGRPASTYTSPAVLHRLSGAPIVFAAAYRTGVLRYRLELSDLLRYPDSGDAAADVIRTTADLAARLEAAIRKRPEQYLWAHRRWKARP